MDIEFFLKNRTEFIRYFYEHASLSFEKMILAIEKGEEPFVPPYSEDPEPPFLEEWIEAKTGTEAVGHAALSMLASSLQLFLKEWARRLKQDHGMTFEVNFKKNGWFNGYREIFNQLELPMKECPADLEVVEQVALARNRVQHPEEITSLNIHHGQNDLEKYPRPFFAQESELALAETDDENAISWWLPPSVSSTKAKIFEAVSQVETLCSWLESEYWKARNA
ncbi:MAG: hypothetical protein Q8N09_05150 [Thermodesulfovibrionia bacterium]|nr:hypothetical protein [Thermodesulfovibrionia bacterium]